MGLYFDSLDPDRRTRLSDNGYWLHFFAAPILFSSVTMKFVGASGSASGSVSGSASALSSLVTLLIVLVFAFVSLLINRRALLVYGLLTADFAIAQIVKQAGLEGMWIGGSTLVMLGGAWHSTRGVLVAPFPKSGPIARIIPPVSRLE